MKAILRSKAFFSFIVTAVLFISLLGLSAPIVDSDDNFYILYTLAGGYGNEPTNLLHYYYEWHPFLFWPVARLFRLFPNFNWYTGFLLALQFAGCAHLLYIFFRLYSKWLAIVLFLLFFLFFGSAYLLSLNHSNTSFLLAISGCSSFLYLFLYERMNSLADLKSVAFPFFLLVISGLLRVPTLALYVLLTLGMGMIILPFTQYRKMFLHLAFTGLVLLAFMAAHKYYYTLKIPHFNREEHFRQSLFYLANHPGHLPLTDTGITNVKNSFIQSWFLYDTSYVTQKDINAFSRNTVQNRISYTEENQAILYWSFINSRVYLLLLAILFFSFITLKRYRAMKQWLLMCLPGILIYLYLFFFMKITEGIFIAILSSLFLSAVYCISQEKVKKAVVNITILGLFFLNTTWMLVRIKKTNDANLKKTEQTRGLLTEISTHPELLFVNSDIEFEDRGFYIWDTPRQYPLINLLNKELLITNSYRVTLRRYRIKDLIGELPTRPDIILFHRVVPLLEDYYRMHKGIVVEVEKIDGFRFIKAWQVGLVSHPSATVPM